MKEKRLIRLIQSFVLSKISYVAAFLNFKADEKLKINGLIKKAFKQAIGLPFRTANDRFEALGIHNTLDELVEAQRTADYEILSQSQTGITYETQACPKEEGGRTSMFPHYQKT